MGQTPAKIFPWPTPFGQSPDANVVTQAMAPPQAPQQNFLPLNSADPATSNANPLAATQPNPLTNRPSPVRQPILSPRVGRGGV